jgi:hypothetical protein
MTKKNWHTYYDSSVVVDDSGSGWMIAVVSKWWSVIFLVDYGASCRAGGVSAVDVVTAAAAVVNVVIVEDLSFQLGYDLQIVIST